MMLSLSRHGLRNNLIFRSTGFQAVLIVVLCSLAWDMIFFQKKNAPVLHNMTRNRIGMSKIGVRVTEINTH